MMQYKRCAKCGQMKVAEENFTKTPVRQKYRAKCKDCIRKERNAKARIYHAEHRDEILAYQRRRYYYNHDEVMEYRRWWRYKNPDKIREASNKRRGRKADSVGTFTEAQFKVLCDHYSNVCLCCGVSGELTRDHVVPLSKGGSNTIDNIQPLCQGCNSSKGTKSTDYRK